MIMWIISNWSVLIWAIPFIAGAAVAWHFLGWRYSAPILALGALLLTYRYGRKMERDNYKKIGKDIEEKREKAYEEIDKRNTSASDAADRLRDGSF